MASGAHLALRNSTTRSGKPVCISVITLGQPGSVTWVVTVLVSESMVEIGVDAVREQVERLLQSKTFQTSEVHRRLLQYLADRTLADDADRLKEYTVGLEAFGKPPTYDPKHDSIVRLQMGRLRQKLAVYYQGEANGDPVLVTIPKGAFKLAFESNIAPAVVEIAPPNT